MDSVIDKLTTIIQSNVKPKDIARDIKKILKPQDYENWDMLSADELIEKNEPLMILTINSQQKVYGYMAAFAGDFRYSVGRMQRFIMNLYSCVSM